jgi:hypothetical protein
MERATKLIVALWTGAALAALVIFIRSGWSALPMLAAGSFLLMAVATAIDRRAVALVLLFAYVFPIVVRMVTHVNYPPNYAVWIAGLLGAMVPDALRSRWHTTGRWRAALICWALTIVVGATIVCLREFDFTTALLYTKRVPNSSIGGWPSMQAAWALHVAIVLLTGILWFDWLHGLSRADFRRIVLVPMAVSCTVAVAVALYQLFVDVTFLNPTVYGAMTRASGTLMDGNVLGTMAALWIGGWLLLGDGRLKPDTTPEVRLRPDTTSVGSEDSAAAASFRRTVTGIVMPLACWLTVWASGSRTGFAAAIIVTLFSASAVVARYRERHSTADRRASSRTAVIAAVLAVAALILLVTAVPTRIAGPIQRVRSMATNWTAASARAVLNDLWQRNGYGTVADVMVRAQPVAGVGIGGFQIMQPDFAKLAGLMPLPADNAQNWFRHQLVEFGLVGGIGWIAWLLTFGIFVVRGRRGAPSEARIARGMLVAFAVISLLGMPGQDISVAVTFWTAAFWYVVLIDAPAAPRPISARMWVAIVAVVGAYGAIVAWQARTTFRVPVRAQRVGWPYSYGVYPAEHDAAGSEFRWAGDHAVAVIDAPTPHLLLTITPNPLAARRPLGVRVEVNRRTAIDQEVRSTQPIVKYVKLPAGEPRVMIETHASPTFRPADAGLADTRELGLMLQWRFLPAEPSSEAALPQ